MATLSPDETILGLLAARPQHGYELLEAFHSPAALGRVWRLSTSQLYNILKRLESANYITGHVYTSPSGPPRTEYCLTEAGHAHFTRWLFHDAPSASIRRVRVEFLSRLYLARLLRLPTAGIIQAQIEACRHELARLRDHGTDGSGMERLADTFVARQLEAVLDWLQHIQENGPGALQFDLAPGTSLHS